MSMKVESIMRCNSNTKNDGATEVGLHPIADAEGEYQKFYEATPYGNVELGLLNEEAAAEFVPGALYRVTFERIGD